MHVKRRPHKLRRGKKKFTSGMNNTSKKKKKKRTGNSDWLEGRCLALLLVSVQSGMRSHAIFISTFQTIIYVCQRRVMNARCYGDEVVYC